MTTEEKLRSALEWFEKANAPGDAGTDFLNEGGWDEAPAIEEGLRQALSAPQPQPAQGEVAIPIRLDGEMIDSIAHYAIAATGREQGAPCANCGKPVEVGQVVLPWDDAGEMHADCEHPYSLKVERGEDEPEPVVLLGEPMLQVPLAALASPEPSQ